MPEEFSTAKDFQTKMIKATVIPCRTEQRAQEG